MAVIRYRFGPDTSSGLPDDSDRYKIESHWSDWRTSYMVIFAWWLVSSRIWELVLLAIIFGTCYGGFVALLPAVTADY